MPYHLLKFLHVTGAIVFVGNIVVTALWKVYADRTRHVDVIQFGQRLVIRTDWIFTAPGAAVVLITGMLMVEPLGLQLRSVAWLARGLDLFLLSGIIWIAVLVPIQRRQARILAEGNSDTTVPEPYYRLGRWWMVFGTVATVLPLINVYLMVAKPL